MDKRASLLAVVALAVLAMAPAVRAQGLVEFTAQGDGTSWGSTANWETLPDPDPSVDPSGRFKDPLDPNLVGTNRLPLSSETAFLRNAVTATISSGTTVLSGLYVGGREYRVPPVQSGTVTAKSTSTIVMTGGSLCVTSGSLWTTAGTLRAASGTLAVGDYYDGQFIQLGGTISTDWMDIANKDPSSTTIPTGYYRLVDGLITNSGTTTLRIDVGGNKDNRAPGGYATFLIDGGAILPGAGAEKSPYVYVASGTIASPYRARGTMTINGGTFVTENWTVGGKMGDGIMSFTGGTLENSDAISVGDGGWANGTFTQTGGSIRTSALRSGYASRPGDADGEINLSGGTMVVASELALGKGMANTGGTSFTGHGVLNVRQTDPNVRTLVDITGTVGDIVLGWGDNKQNNTVAAPGIGELNVYSGSFVVSGAATDFILGGPAADNKPNTQARGTLNIQGGSFVSNGGIQFTPAPTTHVHGVMRVGQEAYCYVNGIITMNAGTIGPSVIGNTSKLIVEVSATDSSMIYLNDVPLLSDTLRVEGVGGWRPREGDTFAIMHGYNEPYDYVWYHGYFSTFESNLSGGQQRSDPNDPNSPLLPLWTAGADPNTFRDYIVTFQGLTAGDCLGDHDVDGGDLALLGGNWMLSGKTWADGDFTGDGKVDGGDLALMGGNWMWSLPAPPEGAPVPEPATMALLGMGGAVLVRRRRR